MSPNGDKVVMQRRTWEPLRLWDKHRSINKQAIKNEGEIEGERTSEVFKSYGCIGCFNAIDAQGSIYRHLIFFFKGIGHNAIKSAVGLL